MNIYKLKAKYRRPWLGIQGGINKCKRVCGAVWLYEWRFATLFFMQNRLTSKLNRGTL